MTPASFHVIFEINSQLKQALPQVKIVQVIHVINEKSVEDALNISEHVDALLLDSGNPENVRRAVEEVNPFGVDVCSGVRTDGILDRMKLEKFILEVSGSQNNVISGNIQI